MGTGQLTLKLEGMRFYAYHGLYPGEREQGGEYLLNLHVGFSCPDVSTFDISTHQVVGDIQPLSPIKDLSQTIDYAPLYGIVRDEMNHPRDLLETVVMSISHRIATSFSCQFIRVEIKKFSVPIDGFTGNTAAEYEWRS